MDRAKSSQRRIVICADDYGLSPSVGTAIRHLIELERITATSCIVVMQCWPDEANRIRHSADKADLGIHLTLTDQVPVTDMSVLAINGKLPSVGQLLRLALFGKLPKAEIAREINAQIELFKQHIGILPVYLDGHHHVHQFPGIRDILLSELRKQPALRNTFIRTCAESSWQIIRHRNCNPKTLVFGWLGSRVKRSAQANGFATNTGFAGFYDFKSKQTIAKTFEELLRASVDKSVFMCHPGLVDSELLTADALTYQREVEYAFLSGPEFEHVLTRNDFTLSWLNELKNNE